MQCPLCQADLKGDKIPEHSKQYFDNLEYFSRVIGIYDLEKDGIIKWQCPECEDEWDREDNNKMESEE